MKYNSKIIHFATDFLIIVNNNGDSRGVLNELKGNSKS